MRGLVACYEPAAAETGRRVFAMGGNVADVAIATAYAQTVVNPFMCGLSGKATIHVRDVRKNEAVVLEAGHIIGSRATPTVFAERYIGRVSKAGSYLVEGDANAKGYQAIMSPGFVPATWQLYERFSSGRLSWQTLLKPAVQLAAEGFTIYPQIVRYWDDSYGGVRGNLRSKLSGCPAALAILFKPDGSPYCNGELLIQTDLARTLGRIAKEGPEVFYKGDIARRIAEDIEANDGFVTYDDMANFPVEVERPIRITYRGYEVTATPPPSNGWIALVMLNILEGYDLAALGRNSPAYAEVLARAMQCAFDDRTRYHGDPRFVNIPLDKLLSKEHAARWRDKIATGNVPWKTGPPLNIGTTHLTVMDADGNAVTMTHSIGGAAGAGVVTEGLGFFHNNHMVVFNPLPGTIYSIVPGKRQGGSVPIIVYKEGQPILAIGGAGGTRVASGTIQAILNVLDHGMSMSEAVAAPRLHSEEDDLILIEAGWPESTIEALQKRGFRVEVADFLGWVNGVSRDPQTRALEGGSEIRGAYGRGFVGYYTDE